MWRKANLFSGRARRHSDQREMQISHFVWNDEGDSLNVLNKPQRNLLCTVDTI